LEPSELLIPKIAKKQKCSTVKTPLGSYGGKGYAKVVFTLMMGESRKNCAIFCYCNRQREQRVASHLRRTEDM
jgi:hypothetical protein